MTGTRSRRCRRSPRSGEFPVGASFGIDGISPNAIGFPNGSADGYVNVERGAVLAGRRIDNSAVDEVVVNQPFVDKYGLSVGDTLTARMFTPQQLGAHANDVDPPNPRNGEGADSDPADRRRDPGAMGFRVRG